MAKKYSVTDIDHLYEHHKAFPFRERNSENHPTPHAVRRDDYHRHREPQRAQFYEDAQDNNSAGHSGLYDNMAHGWRRGTTGNKTPESKNETGMDYPGGFDHMHLRPSMQANKGDTWQRSPSDKASSRQDGDRRHGLDQSRFQGGLPASRKKSMFED